MAVTQYIGSRYVPIFADPIAWSSTKTYEPLTIVLHQGNSFTSKQFVPVGIDITNTDFWAETGNYNAQVEQYRQEVNSFDGRITNTENTVARVEGEVTEALAEIDAKVAVPQAAIDDYLKFQSDFHNNVIKPVRVQGIPDPPAGYRAQGFTIDVNGNVYVAYTGSGDAILRKYSTFTGDGSDLTILSQLVINGNSHANSLNIVDNTYLLISDISTTSNKISVVNLSDFTLQSPITLPYHGINNAAYITGLSNTSYIIGKNSYGHNLQMYQYDGLSRAEAYADINVAIPCECAFSQGCCVNDGMFYEVFSYSANREMMQNYVEMSAPFAGSDAMPCIFPIGLQGFEFEDLCVYGGHMYANTNWIIWDFGTTILELVDQYRAGSWWNTLRFNRCGGIARTYLGDAEPVPATFEMPTGYVQTFTREPNRCKFKFSVRETGAYRVESPWFPLVLDRNYCVPIVRANGVTIYDLIISGRSGNILNISTLARTVISTNGTVTTTNYPDFSVTNFDIVLAIENK